MKKLIWFGLILAAVVYGACSRPGIAGFIKNEKTEWVVGYDDAKSLLQRQILITGFSTPDIYWMKSALFDNALFPLLARMELIEAGLTNQPDFQAYYEREAEKIYWNLLYEKGRIMTGKEMSEAYFNVVRVSHILIDIPSLLKKKQIDPAVSPALAAEYWSNGYILVTNMLEKLQSSPTQKQLFEGYAKRLSQDELTAPSGGDMGYIVEGLLFPEFDQAVFQYSSPILVPQPLKSQYGYHILYITEARKKMTMMEIKNVTGAELSLMMPVFEKTLKSMYAKELYTFDPAAGIVGIGGKDYVTEVIPEHAELLNIWGKPYSWKECRKIIAVFNPSAASKIDAGLFGAEMKSLKNFLYYAGLALVRGVPGTPEFQAELKAKKETWLRMYCTDSLKNQLYSLALSKATPEKVKAMFDAMKPVYDKQDSIKTFESESNAIFKSITEDEYTGIFLKWQTNAVKKYGVVWNQVVLEELHKELLHSK
ncbi:MAG: hypothetical protein A2Y33_04190 [Spirochaetes bacterium GWF1_51_8]|nr:MAG: hypothetical protein A2Y33_04190 [Spirochaetes bacterium GWF1_51_8]